jgi:O-antigen/teichoic acid export membrane protein
MTIAPERLVERAVLTASSQWIYRTTTAVTGLAITPFLVARLGDQQYGMWAVLLQLVGYAALFDVGSSVMKLRLAALAGTGRPEPMRREVGAGAVSISVGLPVYLTAAAGLYGACRGLSASCHARDDDVMGAAWVLLAALTVQKMAGFFSHVLFGVNQEYRQTLLRTVLALLCSLADVAVVAAGGGLLGLAVNKLVTAGAALAVEARMVRRYVDWFGMAWPGWQHCLRSVRENGSYVLLQGWGSAVIESVEAVMIGYVLGAHVVTAYVLTTAPLRQVNNLLSAALNSGNAGIGRLFGSGHRSGLAAIHAQMWSIAAGAVSVGGAVIVLFNESLVRLWVGGPYDLGPGPTLGFVVFSGLLTLSRMDNGWLAACLEIRSAGWSHLVSGVVGLALAALLIREHGPVGMLVGLSLGRLSAVMWAEHRLARVLARTTRMWWTMARAGLCGAGLIAASAMQGGRSVGGWGDLLGSMSMAGGLAAVVFWWAGVDAGVRRQLRQRMAYVVRWGWRSVTATG